MAADPDTNAQLATFGPSLADAVATVLRRHGVPATASPLAGDEVEVRVPASRRAEALEVLAARMEEVRALVEPAHPEPHDPAADQPADGEEEFGRPLVMERLRRMGLGIVLLLAPLLVITLAQPNLPVGYALALFVMGLVGVVFWTNRRRDD